MCGVHGHAALRRAGAHTGRYASRQRCQEQEPDLHAHAVMDGILVPTIINARMRHIISAQRTHGAHRGCPNASERRESNLMPIQKKYSYVCDLSGTTASTLEGGLGRITAGRAPCRGALHSAGWRFACANSEQRQPNNDGQRRLLDSGRRLLHALRPRAAAAAETDSYPLKPALAETL